MVNNKSAGLSPALFVRESGTGKSETYRAPVGRAVFSTLAYGLVFEDVCLSLALTRSKFVLYSCVFGSLIF